MITELIARFFNKTTYFQNWQTAQKQCDSYDSDRVFDTLLNAGVGVEKGDGMFDRDGKIYRYYSENFQLIAAVNHVIDTKGNFHVLDFGGSLGNNYRQNRWFLPNAPYTWCVVEQKRFVETGRKLFGNEKLKFEATITDAIMRYQPNIAFMSNALQRMEHPFDVINELAKTDIPYLFIDRTPVISSPDNRITKTILSAVSDKTYYPTWVFSESDFKAKLKQHYRIINEFNMDSNPTKKGENRRLGFFCEKI